VHITRPDGAFFALIDLSAVIGADTPFGGSDVAFASWLLESPRHIEEFLLTAALYKELDGIDVTRQIAVHDLLKGDLSNIVPLESGSDAPVAVTAHPRGQPKHAWTIGLGLAASLAVLGVVLAFNYSSPHSYSTAVGEVRSIELDDGSVLHLNTHSRVKEHFTAYTRDLLLLDGEAVFKVAYDPRRPFRVHAAGMVIQALGTEFNVYRRSNDTVVAVLDGSVQISAPNATGADSAKLNVGQEANIAPNGKIVRLQVADPAKVTAWEQRRLLFENDRLADIAMEFNRFNRRPQIRVDGQAAAELRLSGIFDANAPDSLLHFLARMDNLSIERTAGVVTIHGK